MEIRVSAPHTGTVTHMLVREGDTVERGQQLAEIQAAAI
jgi:biotin carboxyl carrier protein